MNYLKRCSNAQKWDYVKASGCLEAGMLLTEKSRMEANEFNVLAGIK